MLNLKENKLFLSPIKITVDLARLVYEQCAELVWCFKYFETKISWFNGCLMKFQKSKTIINTKIIIFFVWKYEFEMLR
jgi:hypothetical protein